MGQVLHGCATTTHAVRAALQRSKAPLKDLAAQHGLNPKTVAKWRRRAFVHDAAMGPKTPRSTVLTAEEEAVVVAFRRYTLLPLDDCLYALQATIPHLTRSSLHRCLQRHGISRLPEVGGDKPRKQAFKAYPIGFFHIDIAEVRTGEGKLYLWVAIDRTSKYAFAQLHERADRPIACAFLEALIETCPYHLHTILTDRANVPPSVRGRWRGASSSPSCPRTAAAPPPCTASIASTRSAGNTASSIGSPSQTTRGPMARSSA